MTSLLKTLLISMSAPLTSSLEENMGIQFRNKVVKERIIHQWKFKRRIFQFDARFHPPQLEKANEFGYLIFWNPGSDEVTFWSTVMGGNLIIDPGIAYIL
jgi:hypothetical protein